MKVETINAKYSNTPFGICLCVCLDVDHNPYLVSSFHPPLSLFELPAQ